jgi:hypothetical protein
MSSKTHQTVVAVVPPQEAWGPIQAIRERHARQLRRWPPHLNLLYPFWGRVLSPLSGHQGRAPP